MEDDGKRSSNVYLNDCMRSAEMAARVINGPNVTEAEGECVMPSSIPSTCNGCVCW